MNQWIPVAPRGAAALQSYRFMDALTVTAPNTFRPHQRAQRRFRHAHGQWYDLPASRPDPAPLCHRADDRLAEIDLPLNPGDDVAVAYTYFA
jgi:hypothetical protein